jgi:GNAT superfamily N-acetyltransferase
MSGASHKTDHMAEADKHAPAAATPPERRGQARARRPDALAEGLEAFNESRWPGHQPWQELAAFVRDADGAVAGGLAGHSYAGWLFVQYFWLAEHLRGVGLGRGLLEHAERIAAGRGCHSAHLDTFSFQARAFYEKQGYEVFGALDYPPDRQRFFLRKRLTRDRG